MSASGAVRLRDKIRREPLAQSGKRRCTDVVTLELDEVPDDVRRIVVAASSDGTAGTLAHSMRALSTQFYADVVQNLRPYQRG